MNLILFEPHEIDAALPRADRRAVHLLDVLGRKVGDEFDAGIVNGPRGRGTVAAISSETVSLSFRWGPIPPPLDALTVIVGMPRPQTARDLLRELTSLGLRALHFVATEKSEPGYTSSSLWSSGEWRRLLITGAEQAFDTRIPEVIHGRTLEETLAGLTGDDIHLALDNYEATRPLGGLRFPAGGGVVMAIGAERGWSKRERALLARHGFELVSVGSRVLRVETAAIAAVSILKAKWALM